MKIDYGEAFMAGLLYVVRVSEDGETFEYEYGNLRHAEEHYNSEHKADRVELLEYSTITGTEELVRSK